jgi:hypothetical protein
MRELEVIVPFAQPRDKLPLPANIRSTLIASSLKSVRAHGLFDRYLAGLEAQWHETILHSVAGTWLPFPAGLAHYRACDALGLSSAQQMAIGREVGDRIQGTFLSSMVRAAKGAGVTPWNALTFTGKLYERLFDGGGICVTKLGPKEAHSEMAGNPIAAIGYFRNGFRGLYQVSVELFCTKAYVVDMPKLATDSSCVMKISWA